MALIIRFLKKNFAKKINVKYAISLNSCTSALECALKILPKKGEVIIPSWTWVSTANAVLNTNNKPVFADVDINSRNLTAKEIKKKITKKTVAVIIVHFAGLPCDVGDIVKICKDFNLELIEDSAETLGAKWKNNYTGSFGTGCFSFFPTKNITTTEGGMLTTNSKIKYEKVKKYIAHGINKNLKKHFWHRIADLPGHNFRLPNHLAALGDNQLKRLETFNKLRGNIAKRYDDCLVKFPSLFEIQKIESKFTHSYQMYTFLVKKNLRNNFLYFMKRHKIEASAHFDPPLHAQKYLSKYQNSNLSNTEILSKQIVTLPIYPDLKINEIKRVISTINKWVKINEKF
jgi:perosamine synthetase